MDHHQPYKHHCRICKKGFGCGRALGGHMRAHGINDDLVQSDDDTSADGKPRTYALRTNPNRFKSCRVCENCGKEFLSWKSFLEHGRCPSDNDDQDPDDISDGIDPGPAGWSKGKRTRRRSNPTREEEDLANCLVMLSATRVDPIITVETDESCASASKDEPITKSKALAIPKGMFECKACKKVFNSHQALGGHRASHKKVKGCFAARLDEVEDPPTLEDDVAAEMALAMVPFDNLPLAVSPLKKKLKVHECSICHRVFGSGQALGGHKRCHWITSNSPDPSARVHPIPELAHHHQLTLRTMFEPQGPLDLNLPAPVDGLRLKVPAFLQPWTDRRGNDTGDDEADSKVKLTKLNELKDLNVGGHGSHWLQVGIGPSTNVGGDDP